MKGLVVAKVRSKPEDLEKSLSGMLEKMQPGLAKKIIRDPTEEEQEVVRLSAALKAYAPKVADKFDNDELAGKVERTPEALRAALKGKLKKGEIDKLVQIKVGDNHAAVAIPGRWKTMGGGTEDDPVARFLMWEVSKASNLVNMFKGSGLSSINERAMQGLPKFGSSVQSDIETGCADNMTMRIATRGADHKGAKGGYGVLRLIVAPDELDRTDIMFHSGDKYGCVNPNHGSYGGAYKNRKTLDSALKSLDKSGSLSDEIVVRKVVPKEKILRVGTDTETQRKDVIAEFLKAGITEVNGVPVEDFVVVTKSVKDVYEKYVKPAGY